MQDKENSGIRIELGKFPKVKIIIYLYLIEKL